jgi:glycine cleavage system H protein
VTEHSVPEIGTLPADRLYAPEQDMWVRPESDGTATIGATHIVAAHGQFMIFTPRPAGTVIARDRSMGVMETGKTAVAIHAPLSCRILETNAAAERSVEVVMRDPYGEGWLFRVELAAFEAERGSLMDALTYTYWLTPRLAEKTRPPVDDQADHSTDFGRAW